MKQNTNILKWPVGTLDFSSGTLIMGILNVTPDSFSDGGKFLNLEKAVARGIEMAKQGAAIIDIGAESTRPGSMPVSSQEKIDRAIAVIEKLAKKIAIPISIDTQNFEVAKAALDAGVSLINDISSLSDERMGRLVKERDVPIILMHIKGSPATMQKQPHYDNVINEVLDYLLQKAKYAENIGIDKEKIFIDPGIGFGKTLEHNLELLRNIDKFVASGYRVLVGTSRKSFIGTITGKEKPEDRIFGTAATVALCAAAAVSIVRVHDVEEMTDVVKITSRLRKGI